jgi:hypothetical protein
MEEKEIHTAHCRLLPDAFGGVMVMSFGVMLLGVQDVLAMAGRW